MNFFRKIKLWFFERYGERYGERYSEKIYLGHGDFEERRGWIFRGRIFWYDEN